MSVHHLIQQSSSGIIDLPGMEWFPSDLFNQLDSLSDVVINTPTTYTAEAERFQICRDFTITGAVTLACRQGLLLICRTFTIDNVAGVLSAAGANGGNAVTTTPGAGGDNGAGALGSNGGDGGAGININGGGAGNNGGTPSAITTTANVPDLAALSQSQELGMIADAFFDATVPAASRWGLGGRGGGAGGGGGSGSASPQAGGDGGNGGNATSFANATGGAHGNGGSAGSGAGTNGSVASVLSVSDNFLKLFGQIFALWYYGAGTGGGGGGSGGKGTGTGQSSGAGGGGGAAGSPIFIICQNYNVQGIVTTEGGSGGANSVASILTHGKGAPGAGGGAGNNLLVARSIASLGTRRVNGGLAGTHVTAGNGVNGGAATAGTDGINLVLRTG